MNLHSTLHGYALQLKNQPHTLRRVATVFQKIVKTIYDAYLPNAEGYRSGPSPDSPESDILTVGWLLEILGVDSKNSGYPRMKMELKTIFPSLPERSRFNRRRRDLSTASEVIRHALTYYLPKTEVFIVDSFPIPVCDFKRAKVSKSDFKWADATETLATYGNTATKGLGTFFGFREGLITTAHRLPLDFAIASADTDDQEVLPLLAERIKYPMILGDKGYISRQLQRELLETKNTVLFPTLQSNQKRQYPQAFRKLHRRMRRRIETTISQLTEQFMSVVFVRGRSGDFAPE